MFLNQSLQLCMYRPYNGVTACFRQSVANHVVESLFLFGCGHGQGGVENCVGKFRVIFVGFCGVIQCAVDVGGTTVKGRKEKSERGSGRRPFSCPVAEGFALRVVGQRGFFHFDRADSAKDVGEYLVRVLILAAVLAGTENIISVDGKQNQIISIDFNVIDDFLIEGLYRFLVFEY
ncbi:unknown [Clostridium sp. CAG:448]|nr:unknown [Clostridium sp. CAG:448]